MSGKVRHILALSGGKDTSALAVFMKDKVPCSLLADVGEYLYLLHVVQRKPSSPGPRARRDISQRCCLPNRNRKAAHKLFVTSSFPVAFLSRAKA